MERASFAYLEAFLVGNFLPPQLVNAIHLDRGQSVRQISQLTREQRGGRHKKRTTSVGMRLKFNSPDSTFIMQNPA